MENLIALTQYLNSRFTTDNCHASAQNSKSLVDLDSLVFQHMAKFLDIESMHVLREVIPDSRTECLKPWCEFESGIGSIEIRRLIRLFHRSSSAEQRDWCMKVALTGLCCTLTLTDLVELEAGSILGAKMASLCDIEHSVPIIRMSSRMDLIDLYLGLIKYVSKINKIRILILIDIPDESVLIRFLHLEGDVERIYSFGQKRIAIDEEIRLATYCPKMVFLFRSSNNTQSIAQEVEVIVLREEAIKEFEMSFMKTTLAISGIPSFKTNMNFNRTVACYGNSLTYPWLSDRWVFISDPRSLPTTYITAGVVYPDNRWSGNDRYRTPRLRPDRTLLTPQLTRLFFTGRSEDHRIFMYSDPAV